MSIDLTRRRPAGHEVVDNGGQLINVGLRTGAPTAEIALAGTVLLFAGAGTLVATGRRRRATR